MWVGSEVHVGMWVKGEGVCGDVGERRGWLQPDG